jgi:hypothetical protein
MSQYAQSWKRELKHVSYHDGGLVRFDRLGIPIGPDHGLPDCVERRCLIVIWYGKKWAIPSSHAVWLLVPIYQVVKNIFLIASFLVRIR